MASGYDSEAIICSCKYILTPGYLIVFRFPISRVPEASALIWKHVMGGTAMDMSGTKVGINDSVTGAVIVTNREILVASAATVSRSETAL
jgi:hypothetical protein